MKTIKRNSIFALFLAVVLAFPSCSREEIASPESNAPALSGNSLFETIGQNHNAILNDLGNSSSFSYALANGPMNPLLNAMVPITEQVTGCDNSCHQGDLQTGMANGYNTVQGFNDFSDVATWGASKGYFNSADVQAVNQLNTIVNGRKSTSQANFLQSLQGFEASLANNSALSSGGYQAILTGSTVMRYSDIFWNNVRSNGQSDPWYDIDLDRITPAGPPWYVRDAAAAVAIAAEPWTWFAGPWVGGAIVAGGAALASAG